MLLRNLLSKWLLGGLLVLSATIMVAGCLTDTQPVVEVRPRLVVAPPNVYFQAINYLNGSSPAAGQMLVRWNRSIADTQLNFKGYYIKVVESTRDTSGNVTYLDSIASAHVGRVGGRIPDTSYLFTSGAKGLFTIGTYTVFVWGEKTSDTVQLSTDTAIVTSFYDPRPLRNPTSIEATSVGPNTINLTWPRSPDDTNAGFFRYVIYYRDTTNSQDSGHVIGFVSRPDTISASIITNASAPPGPVANGTQQSNATEYPYRYWVKSERNDSTFIYGTDTNAIVWSGAEAVPPNGNDTGFNLGFLRVYANDTVYFGSLNNQFNVAVDSSRDHKGQLAVSISGSTVTLWAPGPDGVGFLNRIDPAPHGLDSVFYTGPLNDPSQFSSPSITLPASTGDSGGVIVYLMMNDDQQPGLGHQWARVFIHIQADGTFINSIGAIDMKASFQPGITRDGSKHLPFY